MKMTSTDFERVKAAVRPLDTAERREAYRAGNFPNADRCRDVAKRYRWDLFSLSKFPVGPLYAYLNDDHIDTALLRIVQPGLLGVSGWSAGR